MRNTLNDFKNSFEMRFNQQSILDLGEDSVRYDFFVALMNNYNLQPHEIQVEFPINSNAFTSNPHPNAKRGENPQVDLYCPHPNKALTAEFGLFKRNSNPNSSINATEKVFKMLNDMLRLALNKIYHENESFFICIADSTILGLQMRNNILPAFPAELYSFNYNNINTWIKNIKSANSNFDSRFVDKANILGISIQAKLIFNEKILNPPAPLDITNNFLTKALVYKIECKTNANN